MGCNIHQPLISYFVCTNNILFALYASLTYPRLDLVLNPFSTNIPLLYLGFSDVFRGYESGTLVENWVKSSWGVGQGAKILEKSLLGRSEIFILLGGGNFVWGGRGGGSRNFEVKTKIA